MTSPPRLVHVITQLELGGAQLATLCEATRSSLTDDRHLLFGPGGLLDAEAAADTRVRCAPIATLGRPIAPWRDLRALWALYRAVRALRGEAAGRAVVVHTHSSKAGILGRWAAWLAGADVIVHSIHGFGHAHHGRAAVRRLLAALERLTARVTDAFTADSQANIDQGRREGIIGRQLARVVRCGIPVAEYATTRRPAAEVRVELGVPQGAPLVINVACLKPQKDPVTYVRVARAVLREHLGAYFLLVGDGELRGAVEREALQCGVRERMLLLGWRRDVPDLLRASDVLVLTSLWEGLPQVLPQAMAAGLPIVATRVDGAPEAIEDHVNGLLCAPGDVRGLAHAVGLLLGDRDLRARMGAAGRERAAVFSDERMLADVDALYADLLLNVAERRRRRFEPARATS